MITETAILQLKNRAEIAAQKASTYKQQQEAEQLENICNSIIDYYNRTEHLQQQVNNLHAMVQLLCEIIDISQYDINIIQQADANFIRRRLMYRAPDLSDAYLRVIFHFVAVDWQVYLSLKNSIQESKQTLHNLQNYLKQQPHNNTTLEDAIFDYQQFTYNFIIEMNEFIRNM